MQNRHWLAGALVLAMATAASAQTAPAPKPAPAAATAEFDQQAINKEAFERSTALLPKARQACDGVATAKVSSMEMDDDARDLWEYLRANVHSDAEIGLAEERLKPLQAKYGDLDLVPSILLQRVRAIIANGRHDRSALVERRAVSMALLRTIADSGDGLSAKTAFKPCLVANEYEFLPVALKAKKIEGQALEEVAGGSYDVMSYVDADGRKQKRWFDITDAFNSLGKMLNK